MESENAAEAPAEPIANEEVPSQAANDGLRKVSFMTVEETSENFPEPDQSLKEVPVSISAAQLTPVQSRSYEDIEIIYVVPLESEDTTSESASTRTSKTSLGVEESQLPVDDLEVQLSSFIEADDKEKLSIENLEKIEMEKKQKKLQAKQLAKQQQRTKAKVISEKPRKKTRMMRIGNLETEMPSESEEEESPISSDDDTISEISLLSFKHDFLSKLGSLPKLSQISLDREESSKETSIIIQPEPEPEVDPDLKGKFVNAVTGESESESSSEEEEIIKPEEEDIESETVISDFDLPSESDEVPQLTEKPDEVSFFFEDDDGALGKTEFLIETESFIIKRENRRQLEDITLQFISSLLESVVKTVEMAGDKILPERLDKEKMLTELMAAADNFRVEHHCNIFLNSKAVDCCRRMRRHWAYAKLPPEEQYTEILRYRQALDHLDILKEKAAVAKKKASDMTTTVLLEMAEIEAVCTSLSERIEQRIRETLLHKDSELIMKAIKDDMRRMRSLQQEISESRMILISRKHTLAKLIERTLDFEKITDDLTTNELQFVQREVIQLSKRLNERDDRLKMVHERCNRELKRAVYYHERRNFDMTILEYKKEILNGLCLKREQLRKDLCKLKLQHIRNMNQKQELNFKAGLLYKPALMIDYDRTVELVLEKRRKVSDMRNTIDSLEKRLTLVSPRPDTSSRKPLRKIWAI